MDRRRDAGSPAAAMKIGFDVSQTGAGKAGCGYYAQGLIKALEALGSRNEYLLYPAFGDVFWDPLCATAAYRTDNPAFRRLKPPASFEESQRFWGQPAADFETRIGSPGLVHSNNFFCPRGLRQARLVYTLYDLSFLVDPSWSTEANRVGCLDGVFRAATSADWIVADSEYTRRHFLEVFPHYPAERTECIYPGSRYSLDSPGPWHALEGRPERFPELAPGRFWLSVGSLEPRKNHRRLLEAYNRSRSLRNEPDLPLVLAGGKGWLMDDLEAGRSLGPGVMLTGYVSDRELEWLYRNCFAFLYPSLFEGFGMPVLEAMALGAAVICSNTTSLPEVAGGAGLLVDPLDAGAIAAAMVRLASGEIDREVLRAAGLRQARRFSWESSARKLLGVYEECANRGKGF
jgi:glycosyltransferase involved in cell wall biosynthesis